MLRTSVNRSIVRCSLGLRLKSTLTPVNTPTAPPPAANAYSQAIKSQNLIFVSGQVPLTPENKMVEGSFSDRSTQVLENLKSILDASNSSLDHVIKVNAFLTDMGNFGEFNEVYKKYFNSHKPARSCVAVKALPLGADVEVEVVAVEK